MTDDLSAVVDTLITYELPKDKYKINDVPIDRVQVSLLVCNDGCCNEVKGRFVSSDDDVMYEWDMLNPSDEHTEFIESNGIGSSFYIANIAQISYNEVVALIIRSIEFYRDVDIEGREPSMQEVIDALGLNSSLFTFDAIFADKSEDSSGEDVEVQRS